MKTSLERFWAVLNYEELKSHGTEAIDAFEIAMKDTEYYPIDTRFCMIKTPDAGWYLVEASGSVIVKTIEAGDMGESRK